MSNISYFNTRAYLIMLDIGQGDSFLLVLPHNKGNILIDTGGFKKYRKEDWKIKNSEYSIASNILIPVLKSNNIKKIDYLIITHGDMDHIGEAYELVSKYKVLNVVLNIGRENYAERKLICLLKNRGINYSFSNNINIHL